MPNSRFAMDLRSCCAVLESNQGVLDKRGRFSSLVSRQYIYNLEEKGVRHVFRSRNQRFPCSCHECYLLIQLRYSAFITVLRDLTEPVAWSYLYLLFFHRKANSLPWVCCVTVSGAESMEAEKISWDKSTDFANIVLLKSVRSRDRHMLSFQFHFPYFGDSCDTSHSLAWARPLIQSTGN